MSSRHRLSRARTPLRLDTAAIIVPAVESSAGLRAVRDYGSPREPDPQWTRVSGSLSPDLSPEMRQVGTTQDRGDVVVDRAGGALRWS
jgi:hypothetical protein